MEALTLPGKTCTQADFETIRCAVERAESLEHALVEILAPRGRRMTFIRMEDDREPLLLGIIRFKGGSEVFFSLPEQEAANGYRLFDPSEGIKELADTGDAIIDEDWLTRRDRRFRLRTRRGLDSVEMEVPPERAIGFILSYALSRFGQVDVVPEEWFDRSGKLHLGLKLDLSHLGDPRRPGIGETVWIDWSKLVDFTERNRSEIARAAR